MLQVVCLVAIPTIRHRALERNVNSVQEVEDVAEIIDVEVLANVITAMEKSSNIQQDIHMSVVHVILLANALSAEALANAIIVVEQDRDKDGR